MTKAAADRWSGRNTVPVACVAFDCCVFLLFLCHLLLSLPVHTWYVTCVAFERKIRISHSSFCVCFFGRQASGFAYLPNRRVGVVVIHSLFCFCEVPLSLHSAKHGGAEKIRCIAVMFAALDL